MKKSLITFFIMLLLTSFSLSTQNYVANIESTKKNKEPQLIRIIDKNQYESISIGEAINEDDTLQTQYYTRAQILFDGLSIDMEPLTRIVVKYAALKEKQFRANYELKRGLIHVSFDSSKYEDKQLAIYIPYNKSTILVTGTEFDVNSKGYVKVTKGTVRMEKSNTRNKTPKIKFLESGDFGSIDSEIINKDKPKPRGDNLGPKSRDRNKPAPAPKDREPKEPVNAPGMNKAPTPRDNRK